MSGTRTRSRDTMVSTCGATADWYHYPPALKGSYTFLSGAKVGNVETITEFCWDNFHKRKKAGEIMIGDMDLTRTSRKTTELPDFKIGPITGYYGNGHYILRGDYGQCLQQATYPLPDIGSDIGNMGAVALVKAYGKLDEPGMLFGEVANEFTQTCGMLRRPFKKSFDLLEELEGRIDTLLKRRRFGRAQAMAQACLELDYGWRPIFSDMKAIRKAVDNYDSHPRCVRLVARASERSGAIFSRDQTVLCPTLNWVSFTGRVNRRFQLSAHAGIIYEATAAIGPAYYAQALGTRAEDMLSTAWEMIPYSFLVDQFVNVGDWLRAIVPKPGLTIRGSWLTTISEQTDTWDSGVLKAEWRSSYNNSDWYTTYPAVEVKNISISRQANPELPGTPVIKEKMLSVTQLVDDLALVSDKVISRINKVYRR